MPSIFSNAAPLCSRISRERVPVHVHDTDGIQPQKYEVHQVILCYGFAFQVSMNQSESP